MDFVNGWRLWWEPSHRLVIPRWNFVLGRMIVVVVLAKLKKDDIKTHRRAVLDHLWVIRLLWVQQLLRPEKFLRRELSCLVLGVTKGRRMSVAMMLISLGRL